MTIASIGLDETQHLLGRERQEARHGSRVVHRPRASVGDRRQPGQAGLREALVRLRRPSLHRRQGNSGYDHKDKDLLICLDIFTD